jgi:metal-responsive CopG/Arc/MetJ family transcriptional regulator
MSIVNFSIPKVLEKRIVQTIKERGFASRAEFFRFAAINFIDSTEKITLSDEQYFNHLSKELSLKISEKFGGKKMPSIKKQLAEKL